MSQVDQASDFTSQKKIPFKIFISHKCSEHGLAVGQLKEILSINDTLKDKLHIYVSSTDLIPGENWQKKVHNELDEADMLLYIYCFSSPPSSNDWCNYETGYFAKKSDRKNIVAVVPEGVTPPSPLYGYQHVALTYDGIKKLLEIIYLNERTYPQAFKKEYAKDMDNRINSIIKIFNPGQKPIPLSPRIWITIKNEWLDKFKKKEISLPLDSTTISGETEAAVKFGYNSIDKKEITLKELEEKGEFQGTLPLFFNILSDTLQNILNNKPGPWRVPPVRVLNDAPPNILVPAYKEKMSNGDMKIEFVVTRSPINFNYPKENLHFMDLYNLFVIAWHFRWSVLENYINELSRFSSADLTTNLNKKRAKEMIEKLKVELCAIYLDSHNRRLQFPNDIIRNFEGKDKIIMRKIVESREGLWAQLIPKFDKACNDLNLDGIIECLVEMQDLNKTCIVKCIKFLEKYTVDAMQGNIIEDF